MTIAIKQTPKLTNYSTYRYTSFIQIKDIFKSTDNTGNHEALRND